MNTSEPVTAPGAPPKTLAPSLSDKAALLGGTPLAVVSVFIVEALTHTKLETPYAVAIGGVGATVLGYLWHVITVLVDRRVASA